jgi:hypothetical protein
MGISLNTYIELMIIIHAFRLLHQPPEIDEKVTYTSASLIPDIL